MEQLQANVVASIYIRFLSQYQDGSLNRDFLVASLILKVFSVNLQDIENVFSSFRDTLSLGHLSGSPVLGLCTSIAGVSWVQSLVGLTKIPHALQGSQKILS